MKSLLYRHSHLVALALFAIVGVAVLDDYGIGTDEKAQREIGYAALNYILGDEDALIKGHFDRLYGVAVEVPLVAFESLLGLEDSRAIYLSRHLITHILFLVSGFFAWLLAYRMFGNRLVALLAMSLFLLHPRIYAHSFFNSKDPVFLSAFMVALYLAHRAFRRDTVWAFALCGAGVALLMNIRIMGVILPAAVLGMLALDGVFAMSRGGGGVKRTLCNAGAFFAAFAAVLYAAFPLLWENPLELIDVVSTLSVHPLVTANLFRGEWSGSSDPPWDYVPTWMLITAPPVALALAALGTACLARICAADWRGMFANSTARFGLLSAACLILPIVVVAALNSTMFNGWRHMYFLWAPACVLAAFGLGWLSEIPRPRLRATALSLAALGLALAAAEMVGIHPYQNEYFNPLVNKNGLAERWQMNYWEVSQRDGLQALLKMRTDERIIADAAPRGLWLVPENDRARVAIGSRFPDFRIEAYGDHENAIYKREIYGVPLVSVVDARAESEAAYRSAYAAARASAPSASAGGFDIYRDGGALIYIKEACAESDTRGAFEVSMFPLPPYNAPKSEAERRDYSEPYIFGFDFWLYGARFDGKCLISLPLPLERYPHEVKAVETRRLDESGGVLWSAAIPFGENVAQYAAALSAVSEREPSVVESGVAIYADADALTLIKTPCAIEDTAGRFNLSIFPVSGGDLTAEARAAGYSQNSYDFRFWEYGAMLGGDCVISIALPDYPVRTLEAARRAPNEGDSWKTEIPAAGYIDAYKTALSALSGARPIMRAGFDIYARDGTLTYVKSPCAESDARGRFGLSVFPVNPNDLPQSAWDAGLDHEPLNFGFQRSGAIFNNHCVAIRDLPDYPISHLETGQWIPGEGGLWSVRIPFVGYEDRFRRALSAVSGDNLAESAGGFDIYMDGKTLTYVKSPCAESDARGRFELSIFPSDRTDLPQSARDAGMGHESLNFDFPEFGAIIDGDCVIIRNLPGYPISRIETGQWIPGEGGLWSAEIAVGR